MGCVLPAGQGQAPARQAALGAGLPQSVPCTTVNKMCGSGMKAVMMAHDALHARPTRHRRRRRHGEHDQRALPAAQGARGARLGHAEVMDHMFLDGLEDAYDKGRLMGTFAEDMRAEYQFTREAQDAFAIESLQAREGGQRGRLVRLGDRAGRRSRRAPAPTRSTRDEQPFKADPDKIPTLKPAFRKDGTVTAANSSSISDGAAALVLMRASEAEAAQARSRSPGSPATPASPRRRPGSPPRRSAPSRSCWSRPAGAPSDVDLYEINEAFAVVAMAAMRELGLPHEKVNVHGGACALGHPIGASGARILVTLLARAGEVRREARRRLAVHRRRRGDGGGGRARWREDHPHRDRHRCAGGTGVGHPG